MQIQISNIIINRTNKNNKGGYIYFSKVRHLEYVINYSFVRIYVIYVIYIENVKLRVTLQPWIAL